MGNSTTTTVNLAYIYLRRTINCDDYFVIYIFEDDDNMNADYHY